MSLRQTFETGQGGIGQGLARVVESVERTFRPHWPLYALAILFCGATAILSAIYGFRLSLEASLVFLWAVPIFISIVVSLAALRHLFFLLTVEKPRHPLVAMARWIRDGLLEGDRPGNIVHALIVLLPLMVSFAALKDAIPTINPFVWDQTFMEWDRLLHFGFLPHEWLQPILGHPPVTAAINVVYNAWFFVMFFSLFWQAFAVRTSALRLQFLLAFAFTWFVAGNVLATVFSSAGPCFYGRLGLAPDVYAGLMDYLRTTAESWPVWAVNVQEMLWTSYATGGGIVRGISAMPSVHVTTSAIMMFLGWRTSRPAGVAFTLFFVVIFLGSIHLGWHYAVDGYAGIGLAVLFWTGAGVVARRTVRSVA